MFTWRFYIIKQGLSLNIIQNNRKYNNYSYSCEILLFVLIFNIALYRTSQSALTMLAWSLKQRGCNIRRILIDRYTDTLIIVIHIIHSTNITYYNIRLKIMVSKRIIYNITCRVYYGSRRQTTGTLIRGRYNIICIV